MSARTRLTFAAIVATALAAMALLPSFADLRWLPRTVGAVLVVGLVAEGARALGLPRFLSPVCALAGLAAYITAVFAHEYAIAGFIPGAEARAALDALVHQGWNDISELRAPVPSNRGLVLLTACGVGLVAVVVDTMAVVLRRAALAGLPLLALFAVSAATVAEGVGWLPFVYGGVGYLVLLLTDSTERVSRWGRPLGAGRRDPNSPPAVRAERAETAPLMQVGRRVGFAALGVAVVVPALIPGLHPGLFGTRGGDGPGIGPGGSSTVTTYNPITRIKRQLVQARETPLFNYRPDDSNPAYFRMTALDRFDGQGWSQGDLSAPSSQRVSSGGVPFPTTLSPGVTTAQVITDVTATSDLSVPWLPVPYPVTSVVIDGDWRWEGSTFAVFSTRTTTRGLSWRVTTSRVTPTREQLRAATTGTAFDATLAVDDSVPALLREEADRVTSGENTPFDKALALQRYFRENGGFSYSTDVEDGSTPDLITAFLQDRRGYCVQFASTMALMARAVGIPARVAIGFTPGVLQNTADYVVTTRDAHSWPELYFEGLGWLAFEPTPSAQGRAQPPPYTQSDTQPDGGTTPDDPTSPPEDEPDPAATPGAGPLPKQEPLPSQEGFDAVPADDSTDGGPPTALLGGIALGLVLLAAPATGRWLTRRRRWAGAETPAARAHVAWRELGDDVRDLGFGWRSADSPRRASDRLTAAAPLHESAIALRRLANAEERACYAAGSPNGEVTDDLVADERAVRRELAQLAGRRRRWTAAALPRSSLVTAMHAGTGLVADALDLIDKALAWIYRLVLPARLRRS